MNFYDFVFSLSNANIAEMKTVFNVFSSLVKSSVPAKANLVFYFQPAQQAGSSILKHAYSLYPLPTFHHTNVTDTFESDAGKLFLSNKLKLVESSVFAKAINYLSTPDPNAASVTHTTAAEAVTFIWPFNLLTANAATTANPSNDSKSFEIFDENRHVYPLTQVFDPIENTSIDAWKALAYGMTIRNFSFDGSVVPAPNPDLAPGIDNSWFMESAVPYALAYRASRFYQGNQRTWIHPTKRVIIRDTALSPAVSILNDRSKIYVPRPTLTTVDSLNGNALPGLTTKENVTWIEKTQSFFGFIMPSMRRNGQKDNLPAGTKSNYQLVWSPYSVTPVHSNDPDDIDYSDTEPHFLLDFRTIFGTDVPLIHTQDSLLSLPLN